MRPETLADLSRWCAGADAGAGAVGLVVGGATFVGHRSILTDRALVLAGLVAIAGSAALILAGALAVVTEERRGRSGPACWLLATVAAAALGVPGVLFVGRGVWFVVSGGVGVPSDLSQYAPHTVAFLLPIALAAANGLLWLRSGREPTED